MMIFRKSQFLSSSVLPKLDQTSVCGQACLCDRDEAPGSDSWAVHQGWVSVTPLGLKADIATKQQVSCHVLHTAASFTYILQLSIHTGSNYIKDHCMTPTVAANACALLVL